jgi:type I restriction enzyme S subunit
MTELPKGWAEAAAGALCDVVGGATPRTDTAAYWGGEIPWVTPDDLSKDRRKFVDGGRRSLTQMGLQLCAATLVPAGTVLFTSRAPIGYVAIASRPVATNQGFKSLTPSVALTSDFLYWQLQHLTETIRGLGSGTTFAEVSKKVMATVPLRVAPIAEQERIVRTIEEAFSKLDAGEAGLRTVRQLLKRMREAILTAAVTGRLVPQDPTDTPAAKLLADLGVEEAEPEDVPELPPSWAWAELGGIAEVVGGVTKDSKRQSDPSFVEVPYLRVANVQRGFLDLETITTIRVAPEKAAQLELQPGDVLFNEGGDRDKLGRGWVWEGQIASCIHQNHVFRARLSGGVEPKLVSVWGNTFGRGWFEDRGKQTTNLASLNLKTLKAFPVPIAPVEEQSRILAEVERQMSFLDACERAVDVGLARAAGLRRSVLKAAFEGRLVPQDPSDEPASVLLERIRAQRAAQPVAKRRARQTA